MNEENEKLRELVFMAIGEASMCWSEVPSGIFESTRAKKIGDKLMEGISRHQSNPIDPDYAEFKAWRESAAQMSRNAEYYRGLVVKIGEMFGEAAYISDDGSKQQDVLCAKVPELVSAALAPKPEAKTEEGFVEGYKQCKCGSSSAYMNIHKVPCCGGCGAPLEILPPSPATLEPLAVLADRKGFYEVRIQGPTKTVNAWDIELCSELEDEEGSQREKTFDEPTYAAAEQAAKKYLETLEDKK